MTRRTLRWAGPGDPIRAIGEVEGLGECLRHGQGMDVAAARGQGGLAGVLNEEEADRRGRGRGGFRYWSGDLSDDRAGCEGGHAGGATEEGRAPGEAVKEAGGPGFVEVWAHGEHPS